MLHILMVDEQPEILEIAGIHLKKYGEYAIDEAYSATEALLKLSHNSYDAIISDYEMPEMDGLTFLKEVRKINPSVPFIIFSGKGREKVVTEAFRFGADGFVQKGNDPRSQFTELNHQIDIASKRRYAESELRMKEYAIEVSFNGIFMFDDENIISYVNNAAMKLHGYDTKDEVIGENILNFFNCNSEKCEDSGLFSHLSEEGWYLGELEGLKKDGSKFDVQLSVIKIEDRMAKQTYYFGSYIDITEKKKAERALLEFITEAAKRLKEPIHYISQNLSEAIEQIDSGKSSEMLKMKLLVQLKTADQIVENLNELNEAISSGFDSIPEDYKKFLTR